MAWTHSPAGVAGRVVGAAILVDFGEEARRLVVGQAILGVELVQVAGKEIGVLVDVRVAVPADELRVVVGVNNGDRLPAAIPVNQMNRVDTIGRADLRRGVARRR